MVETRRSRRLREAALELPLISKVSPSRSTDVDATANSVPQTVKQALKPLEPFIEAGPPPRYTIDLSLPPRERYVEVAALYKDEVATLPQIFDDLLLLLNEQVPWLKPKFVTWLARLVLRRIKDAEQMEELRGIQEGIGLPMFLLVALNVLLELFVGCTSGGATIEEPARLGRRLGDGAQQGRSMMHFRTLDWGMDPLRRIVVHLDFVERADGEPIASAITYLGFVGVLTAVKQDLSMSLNFRGNQQVNERRSITDKVRYYAGKLATVLGFRETTASKLRSYIIPRTRSSAGGGSRIIDFRGLKTLDQIVASLPSEKTSQSFIILCDGTKATVIEKDWKTALIRESSSFIVCTNHDQAEEDQPPQAQSDSVPLGLRLTEGRPIPRNTTDKTADLAGMQEILDESVDRKQRVEKRWDRLQEQHRKQHRGASAEYTAVNLDTLKDWMTRSPAWGDETHFACIMDPSRGRIVWCERYPWVGKEQEGKEGESADEDDDQEEFLEEE